MKIKGGVASHGEAVVDSQGRLMVDMPDAVSADTVAATLAADSYSTTAFNTGRTWTDGNAIWRKVIEVAGAVPAGAVQTYAHGIASIGRIIKFDGYTTRDDAGTSNTPINYPQLGAECHATIDDTNIYFYINPVYAGAGATLSNPVFIIEYTL